MLTVTFSSMEPRLNGYFGRRALLAPSVIRSYVAAHEPDVDFHLDSFAFDAPADAVANAIAARRNDLVFISVHVWSLSKAKEVSHLLRRRSAGLIVAGGPAVAYAEHESLLESSGFDIVVVGEGEEAALGLIRAVKAGHAGFDHVPNLVRRTASGVTRTPVRICGISEHTYPLLFDSLHDYSRICYETSRGCRWRCQFCLWHKGERLRFYPLPKVKLDLGRIFTARSLQMLEFVDADLFMASERALEILRHVRHLNDDRESSGLNRVLIQIETNPQNITDRIAAELDLHDRILDYGLQTADEALNRSIGRPYRHDAYFRRLHRLVKGPSQKYSEHMLEIVYGLPGGNLSGYLATISLILDLPYRINFWSFHLLVMPGSAFHERASELGIRFADAPPYEVRATDGWSPDDLAEARRLSFHFFLVQYAFPRLYDFVRERFSVGRLAAFRKLFAFLETEYPQLQSIEAGVGEETLQFQRCKAFAGAPANASLIESVQCAAEAHLLGAGHA